MSALDLAKALALISIFTYRFSKGASSVAGGMSYDAMKAVDMSGLMEYLAGSDRVSARDVLEKYKQYYISSADKTRARLELAKSRVKAASISEEEKRWLIRKLEEGTGWLKELGSKIASAKGEAGFNKVTTGIFDKWHLIKLLPSSAEGCALTASMRSDIKRIRMNSGLTSEKAVYLSEAGDHNIRAYNLFRTIMRLDVRSDLWEAEEMRLEAYKEASAALEKLKKING
ncbi:hypothetical protein CUJ83_02770 [Methanocella sp. CWC-04]|uniref:Uncharacterized protein n=1 Tax=Methanooceanicella nereidis TaxID=2052831 RepID=A0AAP2RDD3_9EURY|nr:hypothetical protein [Methanocella sp. CWC-04]MCD1293920.1 hypothetical protein [Methanocella sp. CWC-04]